MNPYHHGDLPRALIEAALDLVSESGPRGFTLTEAARRAGVSSAAPYRHFAGKDDLLAAVAVRGFDAFHDQLETAAVAIPDAEGRLVALGREYVRWAVANPAYYQVMFASGIKRAEDDAWRESGERAFSVLISAIKRAQTSRSIRRGDPLRFAAPIWALLHGLASLHVGGDLDHVEVSEPVEQLASRSMASLLASPEFRPRV